MRQETAFKQVINPELLNAHTHDAKHVLSSATLENYRDPSDPRRSLIIQLYLSQCHLLHNLHSAKSYTSAKHGEK